MLFRSRAGAGARLSSLQRVLEELWKCSPPNQPRLVRDARWLIPLAQSPITDELAPYFEVARRVRESLPEADRVEIQKAHVRMQGAHLTSQVRHYSLRDGVPVDDLSVVMRTRSSNALDFALTVQGLVDVLHRYELALQSGDETLRLSMAGAVFQAISPDPELFLHRIPLLYAYCMIEDVLVAPDGYSELGEQHRRLHARYAESIARLIPKLRDDLPRFRPVEGAYSSYGMLYGTPSNLVDLMAVKAAQHDAESRFSLEDVFNDSGDGAAKLAWVNGWRTLPHVNPETQRAFHLPQDFAQTVYERLVREFHRAEVPPTGRLRIEPGSEFATDLPEKYFGSYDTEIGRAHV